MNRTLKYTSTCLGLLAVPLSANIRMNFDTDASGNPIVGSGPGAAAGAGAGSFSGTGTVDGNIVTGAGGIHEIVAVGNGAVLMMDIVDDHTNQDFAPEVPSIATTFGLTGGTADVRLARNGDYWKGFSIDNMAGATELCLTSVIDVPFHGRNHTNSINSNGLPWGMSTALLAAGAGLSDGDFNVTYTISGLIYLSDSTDPATASTTIPAPLSTLTLGNWENETFSGTDFVFESTNGFDAVSSNGANDPNNLLVRGVSATAGGVSTDDIASFYATTFQVCITPTGLDANGDPNTFAEDTRFIFSYDGNRTQEVPEPTSALIMALASVALIGRRKR